MLSPSLTTVVCDAHVHIYDCFDLDDFFDHAWRNLKLHAQSSSGQNDMCAVLMLTETQKDHWFLRLGNDQSAASRWSFHNTSEPDSLLARDDKGHKLFVISGRQIVTAENLEVLALATDKRLPDGKPIPDVVEWAISNNAIPVIPWGFGKWWGKRGDVLSSLLNSVPAGELSLGDNSGRPWLLGKPGHFKVAEITHRRILPGSDPLPFPSEAWRPGSAGFYFNGFIDASEPARCLRDYLADPDTTIGTYMRCERLIPFVRNQVAMQIRKRRPKK
jgi:hypothetical protein